jgi:predicted transcriptional regulator YdeE
MNKKVTLLAIAVAILVLVIGYMYLGGLNKVEITLESVSDYNLVGVHYQGRPKAEAIETAFFTAREHLDNGRLNGVLTLVHYNDTTLVDDHVKLFVGIKLNEGTSDLPEGYERLTIPASNAIRATIEAHNVVMPTPENIEISMKEKAAQLNLRLQDYTIEQYFSARELTIEIPVK